MIFEHRFSANSNFFAGTICNSFRPYTFSMLEIPMFDSSTPPKRIWKKKLTATIACPFLPVPRIKYSLTISFSPEYLSNHFWRTVSPSLKGTFQVFAMYFKLICTSCETNEYYFRQFMKFWLRKIVKPFYQHPIPNDLFLPGTISPFDYPFLIFSIKIKVFI